MINLENDLENDDIVNAFRETRRLCVQISQLLLSAERLLKKHNWSNATNQNYGLNDLSWSVEKPTQWLPIYAFRFFKNTTNSKILAFVSVLMDDHFDKEYTLKESVVTAGFFEYNQDVKENWEYKYARYYGYLAAIPENNLRPDQQPFRFVNDKLPDAIKGDFVYGKIFAVRLSDMKDEKALETKVIKPLLNMLTN
jgi:hypothetical protein